MAFKPHKINRLGLRLLRLLGGLIACGGYSFAQKAGSFLGFAMWHALPSRRKLATETIRDRLGLPDETAGNIARQSFKHNARSFLEIFLVKKFGFANNPKLAPLPPEMLAMMADPGPIVAVTAHLGAWELLAGLAGEVIEKGRPHQVVTRNQGNRTLNAYIAELRGGRGTETVGHRNAAPAVLAGLKKNGLTAFLVDHNSTRSESVFLPFLGLEAAVNFGPALLALRAKANVYPIFLLRGQDGLYHLRVGSPLNTATLRGSINDRTRLIAEFYTAEVEKAVREHPEQWFWMHKRWKTRPQ